MPRKIADNCFIKGHHRGLRKKLDTRTDLGDLSGPVTATPRFEFIIPGLDGLITAVLIEKDESSIWIAFFLDGTSGDYRGQHDGLYVLDEGEDPSAFLQYFSRPFKKLTESYWGKQTERLISSYQSGIDDSGDPTLDLTEESQTVREQS